MLASQIGTAEPAPVGVVTKGAVAVSWRACFDLGGLGSVGIHREFITAAARWIMEAKL